MEHEQIGQLRPILERHKTADSVRAFAYQLWAFEAGRNATTVAKQLGCHKRTVEAWASKEHWHERADADIRALMPDLLQQATDNFRLAVLHLSRRALALSKALEEDGTIPDRYEVDAIVKLSGLAGFAAINPLPQPTRQSIPAESAPRSTADLIAQHHHRLGLDVD